MRDTSTVALLRALVAINSANPATCSIGAGEREIANFCATWLSRRGVQVEQIAPKGQSHRPCVVARAPGTGGGRTLLLLGHLDTYTWFQARNNCFAHIVAGPGALDMKAGIAIILSVLCNITGQSFAGHVSALLVCDEEHGSLGARTLLPNTTADGAVVVESTGLQLCTSHAGRLRIHLPFMTNAERDAELYRILRMFRLNKPCFQGLTYAKTNEPALILQKPVPPGTDAVAAWDDLKDELYRGSVIPIQADVRESFAADTGSAIVATLKKHVIARELNGTHVYAPGWTEAAIVAARQIPCVVFGPGGGDAHRNTEWVDSFHVERVTEILTDVAIEFCA